MQSTNRLSNKFLTASCILLFTIVSNGCSKTEVDTNAALARAAAFEAEDEVRAAFIELRSAVQAQPEHAELRLELGRVELKVGEVLSAIKNLAKAGELGSTDRRLNGLLVRAYLDANKYEKALETARSGLAQSEHSSDKLLLAEAEFRGGNPDLAIKLIEGVRRAGESQADAALAMAKISLAHEDFDEAEILLMEALRQDPRHPEARFYQGRVMLFREDTEAAINAFSEVPSHHLALDFASRLGIARANLIAKNFAEAKAVLSELAADFPDSVVIHYYSAVAAFQRSDYDAAVIGFREVLSKVPTHTNSQYYLGIVLYFTSKLEQAAEYLSIVLEARSDNVALRKLVSSILIKLRRYDDAIEVMAPIDLDEDEDVGAAALKGIALLGSGDFDDGRAHLKKVIEADPENDAVLMRLVLSQVREGRHDEAIQLLGNSAGVPSLARSILLIHTYIEDGRIDQALELSEKLLLDHPDSLEVSVARGVSLANAGRFEDARAVFETVIERDPEYAEAHQNLTLLDLRIGNTAAAMERVKRLMKIEKGRSFALSIVGNIALERGRVQDAIAILEQARFDDADLLEPRLELGRIYASAGEFGRAAEVSLEALRIDRTNLVALRNLATVRIAQNHVNDAVGLTRQLLISHPEAPSGHIFAAHISSRRGENEKAVEYARRALALAPHSTDAHAIIVRSLIRIQDYEGARAQLASMRSEVNDGDYYRIVELEGDLAIAQGSIGEAVKLFENAKSQSNAPGILARKLHVVRMGLGKSEEAEQAAKDYLIEHPDDFGMRVRLAKLYKASGKLNEAAAEYDKALELAPTSLVVLNNLANVLSELGDQRALELVERAFEFARTNPAVIDSSGWIALKFGRNEKALSRLKLAAQLAPRNAEINYHYAVALSRSKQTKRALEILEKIDSPPPSVEEKVNALKSQLRR